ncbi:MAG TPA: hypothetical protein ENN09_05505 [Planctomycetes bacterium]|nr:hypothetical protein [Planctomycetota bacterium]
MRTPEDILESLFDGEELPEDEEAALLRNISADKQFREEAADAAFMHGMLSAYYVEASGESAPKVVHRRRTAPRRKSGWLAPLFAAAAACVIVVALLSLRDSEQPSAAYPRISATGHYTLVGGTELGRGVSLVTGGQQASIFMGGYCRVDVLPATEITIEGDERAEQVHLKRGGVSCEVKPDAGSFAVRTEVGTAQALGTRFSVEIIEEGSDADMHPARMRVKVLTGTVLLIGSWGEFAMAAGQEGVLPGRPGAVSYVNNIKVLSDKVEDVSTIEALLGWAVKPGMTDREKGLALWEAAVKFRHQDSPSSEWVESEGNVCDPIKLFNVYGYNMCNGSAAVITALGRAAGLQARGRIITAHSVAELFWDGKWHLLDASLINYFFNKDGDVASVDEIIASVTKWYAENPEYRGNEQKIREFMRNWGWKKGPEVLATGKFYDQNGWLPAATHGWYASMGEYDGKNDGFYEYGYAMGYRALFKLRRGEVLTRNWSNKGLHANMDVHGPPGCMNGKIGQGDLRYAPQYGDLAPGRVGNGTLVFKAPLGDAWWRPVAASLVNVKNGPGIAPQDVKAPAEAVFRMQCPYVFLTGKVRVAGTAKSQDAAVRVLLSTNNGLEWKELKRVAGASFNEEMDFGKQVIRRYDYYVKLILEGDSAVSSLEIVNDIQHSQRPLPALAQGRNTVTVHAGPSTNTITIAPSLHQNVGEKNEAYTKFRPEVKGLAHRHNALWPTEYRVAGTITFPVETPGDITAVRMGGHFRARDAGEGVEFLLSFDDGKTWVKAGDAMGPFAGFCKDVPYNTPPEGARKVLIRYSVYQKSNVAGIMGMRMDVDYWDTPDGKPQKSWLFHPLKTTYVWEENGVEKRDVRMSRQVPDTYTIDCASKPLMKSIIVELAE